MDSGLTRITERLRQLLADDRGQDLIEYAMLLGTISVLIAIGVMALSSTADSKYGEATGAMDRAGSSPVGRASGATVTASDTGKSW